MTSRPTPKRRDPRARSCAALRSDVWTLLHYRTSLKKRSGLQRASYILELCVLVLITLNVVLAMYVSASPLGPAPVTTTDWYELFLYVSTALFTVEYVLRLWSLKWMLRPMSMIDLIVLIPFYVEILLEKQEVVVSSRGVLTLRGFRLLRIMSFLHLERSYQAMKNLREIFAAKKEELGVVSYLTIVILLTSSTTIFFLENPAQPEVFSSIGTCGWWAIETITSLGYGDIVPITAAGRAFSSLLALFGIILFTIPGAVLGSGFVEQKSEQAMEESIRISLTRELRSLSSNNIAFAGGLDSPKMDLDSPVTRQASGSFSLPPRSFSTPHNYSPFVAPAPPIVRLQEQVDKLTATQNPHEEKQKALLQRITGSVARLHEVLKEINTQIEKSDSFREELTLTCQVWKGYESRVQSHCDTAAAATQQR
uniref:Ion transport domain-containing protein n=1 Tax=Phytophthora ramorum TaxID=164328 RepID=H3HCU8_PHYRM